MTLDEALLKLDAAKSFVGEMTHYEFDGTAHQWVRLMNAQDTVIRLQQAALVERDARVTALEQKLAAVEAVADKEYIPWMTDYSRERNSEWTKLVCETAWGNGAYVVQSDILIALGIMSSAEEYLAHRRAEDAGTPTADGEAT